MRIVHAVLARCAAGSRLLASLRAAHPEQLAWCAEDHDAGGHDTSKEVTLFQRPCTVVDHPTLIRAKRAAGRPEDLEVIAELEALLEE